MSYDFISEFAFPAFKEQMVWAIFKRHCKREQNGLAVSIGTHRRVMQRLSTARSCYAPKDGGTMGRGGVRAQSGG